MQQEDGAAFAPGNPFHFCFLHMQYTPFISTAEKELREILEHEAGGDQWTGLFQTQESMTNSVRVLQSKKSLKW